MYESTHFYSGSIEPTNKKIIWKSNGTERRATKLDHPFDATVGEMAATRVGRTKEETEQIAPFYSRLWIEGERAIGGMTA